MKLSIFSFPAAVAAIIAFSVLVSGCGDDFSYGTATAHYSGDWNNGGCGWILQMPDSSIYETLNMPDKFKVEGLEMKITFKVLEESPTCTSLKAEGILYLHKIDPI